MTWRRSATFTDTLSLIDVKKYLRVNFTDDDGLILSLIDTSLEYVDSHVQRPSLATGYSDQYGEFSTFPTLLLVGGTEAPIAKPQMFYTDTGGTEVELAASEISYDYSQITRTISLSVENVPDIQADSFIRVNWSVNAVAPEIAIASRKLLIANWYENREASVAGANNELKFGINALLSPNSLVL